MAASGRRPPASLIEALRACPERFDFLQAVRILERAALIAARDPRFGTAGRIGLDHDPRSEIVLLRAVLELGFPASEIAALDESGKRPELSVAVMGLNGPSGVLPGHYSQLVMETLREKNTALRDFLDMFNHRALSLFARAMEKYRLPLAYERAGHESLDTISSALYALIGMHEPTLRRRLAVPDAALLFYSGHMARTTRPAGALGQMLSEYFERPVRIGQFQGRWVGLPETEQTRLGGGRGNAGRYAELGVSTVIGSRIWDVQGSFRVRLGPLDYAQFLDFMPDGAQMAELAALTRSYVGPALSFDVQLTLKAGKIPPLRLTRDEKAGPRLGWNTWLPTEYHRADASDAIFRVETI
jgi:type VI secretion system protein ImpH